MGSSRQKTYKILFGILGVFIFLYGISKVTPLIRGPEIFVEGIINGENHGPVAFISGSTKGARELRLNDNEIMLDESGNFSETLLLSPGYNMLYISAKDNFGRENTQKFEITADEFNFADTPTLTREEETEEVELSEIAKEIPKETGTELST